MEVVACEKDDSYSLGTPQTSGAVMRREENRKATDMDAFFDKFWKKQEEFQEKFSAEIAALVVNLRETVEEQRKEMHEQRTEIAELKERMKELEKKRVEGGSMVVEEVVNLMQGMITAQVGEFKEKAKRECQLRITGLKEDDRETPKMLRMKVSEVFEEKMKVEEAGVMIVDSFRIGKKGEDQFGRPRVVIARLGSVGQRNEILRGKRNLGQWRGIGVDVDRTKEEMEAFKGELKKKKDLEDKGGKAAFIKGKMVILEAPSQVREEEEAHEEGGEWVQQTRKKGKKKSPGPSEDLSDRAEASLTKTRRSTRSTTAAKGSEENAA
jgi:hypothetical protein